MERIEKLRQIALEKNTICKDEFYYKFYKVYAESDKTSKYERYADAFYYAFSNLTPHITDGELIVGEFENGMTQEEQKEWEEKFSHLPLKECEAKGPGQDSHMSIDYDKLLNLGVSGIIKQIDEYMKECKSDKIEFYKACKRCLEAVIIHSENYADYAEKLAENAEENRKKELLKLAEILRKVPKNPPESFYEAVQSVHFITYSISANPFRLGNQQFQLGHPDRYLLPYYLKDIENGTITKEYAQLLLDLLGIQMNMRVTSGVSSGYMVGGRDEKGELVQNDLTEMCMQVIDDIRLVYPAVGLCYTDDLDKKYIKKACEILSHGRSHPAIFNDDIITKGLLGYGVPEKDARNYIHSTCVEITPTGASNVWVASPYTNMAQLLLDILDREYKDYNELLNTYFNKLDIRIKENFKTQCAWKKHREETAIIPLLSCFVSDCLEQGIDIEQGGARYNWIMPSFVGMANLVDSLYAIKELVFDKKELTMKEFKEILDCNFENNEELRKRILNDIPKYGNDIDDIDEIFGIITEHIISECKKYKGEQKNSKLIPSVFCWIRHETFGRETGATPDGRKKGFPLGDGSGPAQGREMNGPTASILSSTKWKHHELIGGVAVNMKFPKKSLGKNSKETMRYLIETYMERGGFEMQINVLDKKTLKDAIKNPEQYKDLLVRVGGYSDYFVRLSPEMQKEIILRTEHSI